MNNFIEFLMRLPLIIAVWTAMGALIILECSFVTGIIAKLLGYEVSIDYLRLLFGVAISGLVFAVIYHIVFRNCLPNQKLPKY